MYKEPFSRRQFISSMATLTTASLLASTVSCTKSEQKPNILWITAEDICPDLGCYGDVVANTPNIDRLASEGVLYTNAFSVSGVCSPSRSCLITGMYPTTIGSHHMRCGGSPKYLPKEIKPYEVVPPPHVKCFTEYLRAAGYYCTNRRKTDYQFGEPFTAWDDCSDTAHWRKRPKGKPFFSVFNHMITHESRIRIPLDKKPVTDPAKIKLPPYFPDTPVIRNDWARYYDNIATMDRQVAELLNQLQEDGLSDNTIVFFFGDNGRGLPRGKRWIYNAGIHVPLIIRWPGHIKAGTICDDLVSFVDFAPTVLSLAAVRIPEYMQGKAFLGKQTAPARRYIFAARDRMDENYDYIRAVRDKRYKYIRNYMPQMPYAVPSIYMDLMPSIQEMRRLHAEGKLEGPEELFFMQPKPTEELYDTLVDPHEVNNLANSPEHQEILTRMRNVLDQWRKGTKDMGDIPENEMIKQMWPGGKQPKTSPPAINPNGGRFNNSVTVKITCPTEGASIGYTTDKGENSHWLFYSEPIKLTRSCTLRTKAIRYGYQESAEATAYFQIT